MQTFDIFIYFRKFHQSCLVIIPHIYWKQRYSQFIITVIYTTYPGIFKVINKWVEDIFVVLEEIGIQQFYKLLNNIQYCKKKQATLQFHRYLKIWITIITISSLNIGFLVNFSPHNEVSKSVITGTVLSPGTKA